MFFIPIILFLFLSIVFIRQIMSNKPSFVHFKLQRTLIISANVQIFLTIIFQLFPWMMFHAILTFEIPYGGPIIMVLLVVEALHPILEMISTLYFVLPYRRFFVKFRKKNILSESRIVTVLFWSCEFLQYFRQQKYFVNDRFYGWIN